MIGDNGEIDDDDFDDADEDETLDEELDEDAMPDIGGYRPDRRAQCR